MSETSGFSDSSSKSPSILEHLQNFAYKSKPVLSSNSPSNIIVLSPNDSDTNDSPVRAQRKYPVMVISSSDSDSDVVFCDDVNDDADKDKERVLLSTAGSSKLNEKKSAAETDNNSLTFHPIITDLRTIPSSDSDLLKNVETPALTENNTDVKKDTKKQTNKKRGIANGVNKKKKRKKKGSESDSGSGEEYLHRKVYNSDDESDEEDMSFPALDKRRLTVVKLLNDGTDSDLNVIPTMSQVKLQIIMSLRPFTDWRDTVLKFRNTRGLSTSILNATDNIILARNIISNLMKKCEALATKTEKSISSKGTLVSKPPSILNPSLQLTSYQMIGLNWLAIMHSQSLNSILADEMGLGKTIQTIAFLAYLKEIGHVVDDIPHLIIVPASTLDNWRDELERWCPSLKVALYHGSQDERRLLRYTWVKEGFNDIEVILTSYSCITKSFEEKKLFRVKEFNYIIFDEAHMLKNMNTQRYEALMQFNGNFKILLTGTPLQNNLLELMSLLIFLMPDLFEAKSFHLKLLFAKPNKTTNSPFEQEKIDQAKRIMEPFMMRRLKCNVLKDLPDKISHVIQCPMHAEQAEKYKELTSEFHVFLQSDETDGYMMYFMMLRKLSNHPLLLRYIFTEDKLQLMAEKLAADSKYKGTVVQYIKEDLYFKSDYELHLMCSTYVSLENLNFLLPVEEFTKSGKFSKLGPLLEQLKQEGHRVLIFSQFILMLDLLQEFMKLNDYLYLRLDGSTPVTDRQDMINMFNTENDIFVFLLSTKAGGLGINLTAADTVIIHDMDFNPYNDKQAEDRCHRVGQTKTVSVFRFVSENTIEDRIYEIAQNKLHLEREISASNDNDDVNEAKSIIQLLKETLGIKDGT